MGCSESRPKGALASIDNYHTLSGSFVPATTDDNDKALVSPLDMLEQ